MYTTAFTFVYFFNTSLALLQGIAHCLYVFLQDIFVTYSLICLYFYSGITFSVRLFYFFYFKSFCPLIPNFLPYLIFLHDMYYLLNYIVTYIFNSLSLPPIFFLTSQHQGLLSVLFTVSSLPFRIVLTYSRCVVVFPEWMHGYGNKLNKH